MLVNMLVNMLASTFQNRNIILSIDFKNVPVFGAF